MKLLVTGALGHIGSRFIRSLKPGDWESIVLLDDLSTQRYGSLFNLPEGVPFRFVEGDVCTADLERYFEGVDFVIHLAAITDAPSTFERPEEVERVNCEGTRRVAEACGSSGSKLVFILARCWSRRGAYSETRLTSPRDWSSWPTPDRY